MLTEHISSKYNIRTYLKSQLNTNMTELARFARSLTKNCGHFTFVHTDILAFMIFARKNSTPGMQMSASMLVSIAVRYLKGTVPPFHKQVYT